MKLVITLLASLAVHFASAQVRNNGVKATDNNVKIPNGDIIRMAAQRPRDGNTSRVSDSIRRANQYNVNTNINAQTGSENSNAIKVDVGGQSKGIIASPIGSEPTKSNVTVKVGSTKP